MDVRHSAFGTPTSGPDAAYETALRTAIADLERALADRDEARTTLTTLERRISDLTDLVRQLRSVLPLERQPKLAQRTRELTSDAAARRRGGQVFDNVVDLLKRDQNREWSAAEIKEALGGRVNDPKQIYNVLAYLARKGQLKRLSRGRYLIKYLGVELQLDQEIPGADDGRGDWEGGQ